MNVETGEGTLRGFDSRRLHLRPARRSRYVIAVRLVDVIAVR